MAAIRKIKRVGKRAFKFQYSATYQSAVIECQAERWYVCLLVCVVMELRKMLMDWLISQWMNGRTDRQRKTDKKDEWTEW